MSDRDGFDPASWEVVCVDGSIVDATDWPTARLAAVNWWSIPNTLDALANALLTCCPAHEIRRAGIGNEPTEETTQ